MRDSARKAVREAVRREERLPAGRFDEGHAKGLRKLLKDDDPAVRAEAGRGLADLGELDVVLDALVRERLYDDDLQAPLEPVLADVAAALTGARPAPRAELARVLRRSERGRVLLRSALDAPGAPWELECDGCGAVVEVLRLVPPLWPTATSDGDWSVAPEGPQLLRGDPAEGRSLGRQSGAGESGRAFEARDLAALATALSDGLPFVCVEEPRAWCRERVVIETTQEVEDVPGWDLQRTVTTAHYPDGHSREVRAVERVQ